MLVQWVSLLFALAVLTPIAPSARAAEASEIGRVLQPFVERQELAGAVTLVATKDKILNLEAVGYFDVAARSPMKTDAMFWVASMTKSFTGAAIMRLVDQGKVRLDDPVARFLPEFTPQIIRVDIVKGKQQARARQPLSPITIREILSNTSGLRFSSSIESPTLDTQPFDVRVQSYALEPLLFEPGTKFLYADEGFNVAARIIEVVSESRYEDFLQKEFFDPLGMKDTTFWPTGAQLARLAKSYRRNASETGLQEIPIGLLRQPLDDRKERFPEAGAGLFSTATDIGRFCQMILNQGAFEGRRYLSEAAVDEMVRNQLSASVSEQMRRDFRPLWIDAGHSEPVGYGSGWARFASGAYGHAGAYKTEMKIDPTKGLITVWMVQYIGFAGPIAKSRESFERAVVETYVAH